MATSKASLRSQHTNALIHTIHARTALLPLPSHRYGYTYCECHHMYCTVHPLSDQNDSFVCSRG